MVQKKKKKKLFGKDNHFCNYIECCYMFDSRYINPFHVISNYL